MTRRALPVALLLCALASDLVGQNQPISFPPYHLPSVFAPIRTSAPGVAALFTQFGSSLAPISIAAGTWIELDLPSDEEGRATSIAYFTGFSSELYYGGNPRTQTFDVFVRDAATSPFAPAGTFVFTATTNPWYPVFLSSFLSARTVRFVARDQAAPPILYDWLGVAGFSNSLRRGYILNHAWYVAAPPAGTPVSAAVAYYGAAGDALCVLLGAPGPALLTQPIRLSLHGQGGLLLDPARTEVLATAALAGGTSWNAHFLFPFDPVLLSTPVHFQAAFVRSDPLLGTVVVWSPPLTF